MNGILLHTTYYDHARFTSKSTDVTGDRGVKSEKVYAWKRRRKKPKAPWPVLPLPRPVLPLVPEERYYWTTLPIILKPLVDIATPLSGTTGWATNTIAQLCTVMTYWPVNLELDTYCPWTLDLNLFGANWIGLSWILDTNWSNIQQRWTHLDLKTG
jgi:hypothetical protein